MNRADGYWWFSISAKRPTEKECRLGGKQRHLIFKGMVVMLIIICSVFGASLSIKSKKKTVSDPLQLQTKDVENETLQKRLNDLVRTGLFFFHLITWFSKLLTLLLLEGVLDEAYLMLDICILYNIGIRMFLLGFCNNVASKDFCVSINCKASL
jgi:hypothetical protein